jgi:transcription termination/antitermination protein NusA
LAKKLHSEGDKLMSMIQLPGINQMIETICRQRNLPKHAVREALVDALKKGYERYRKTYRDPKETSIDEMLFDNFTVEIDADKEGFRVLATKTIVENVTDPDQEIALGDVRKVAPDAEAGGTVVVDVTPEKGDFGRMAAIQTKQVLSQKLRDQQRKIIQEEFHELEGTVIQARVMRFEGRSVICAVSSGFGQNEVEAELPKNEQLPNEPYRTGSAFKVFLRKVWEGRMRAWSSICLPTKCPRLRTKWCASSQLLAKRTHLRAPLAPALRSQSILWSGMWTPSVLALVPVAPAFKP